MYFTICGSLVAATPLTNNTDRSPTVESLLSSGCWQGPLAGTRNKIPLWAVAPSPWQVRQAGCRPLTGAISGCTGTSLCPQVHTTCGGRCCWRPVISLRPQGRRSVCLVITGSADWGWQEVSGDRRTEPGDPGHTGCAEPLPVGTASQTETGWQRLSLRASPKSTCQARAAGGNSCGTKEMPELRLYSLKPVGSPPLSDPLSHGHSW